MSEMYVPSDAATPALATLVSKPGFLDGLASDPRGTLSTIGVAIDDSTAAAIQAQVKTPIRPSTTQASIVHFDT
jgi:hypothetical protein